MLNCLNAIRSVIIMYQYTDLKLEMLKAQIEANEDVLVSEQASLILSKTDTLDIYSRCVAHQSNQGPLSKIPGMEQALVERAIESFNDFLLKPEGYQCSQTIKVSSARSRETIQKRTFENVVNAYRIIYGKLQSPDNLYSLKMKPIEEVKKLFERSFLPPGFISTPHSYTKVQSEINTSVFRYPTLFFRHNKHHAFKLFPPVKSINYS